MIITNNITSSGLISNNITGLNLGQGSGSSAWSPADLTNLLWWYDIYDLDKMWTTSAKTTNVAADGDPVGYFEDSSGNGHDVHQPTAGNRLVFRTDGTLNWLEFDGATSNRWLQSVNTIDMTGTNDVTICAAVTRNVTGLQCIVEHTANGGTVAGGYYLFADMQVTNQIYSTFGKGSLAATQAMNALSATIVAPNTRALVATNPIDSFSKIRANGVETTAASGVKGTGNYANSTLYIGRRAGTSLPLDGDIYALFTYTDIKTGADLTSIETYLAQKSGVTL